MKQHSGYGGTVFVTALLLFFLVLSVFVGVFERRGAQVDVELTYYFLVRDCDSATAGAVAGESYFAGGAGYLLDSEELVVLACYYREEDLTAVVGTMSESGVAVRAMKRQLKRFTPHGECAAEHARIAANIKAADSCAHLLYDAANKLERGEASQEEARAYLRGAAAALDGLAQENESAVFALWNAELRSASRRLKEYAEGILYAKDLRYSQVALAFLILEIPSYFT